MVTLEYFIGNAIFGLIFLAIMIFPVLINTYMINKIPKEDRDTKRCRYLMDIRHRYVQAAAVMGAVGVLAQAVFYYNQLPVLIFIPTALVFGILGIKKGMLARIGMAITVLSMIGWLVVYTII